MNFKEFVKESDAALKAIYALKVKDVVEFYDDNGKKEEGIIVKIESDEAQNGRIMKFFNIETKSKLHKDVPEGDIIKKVVHLS